MSLTLAEVARLVGGQLVGDGQIPVTGAATIAAARPGGRDDVGYAVAVDVALRDAHAAEKPRIVNEETLITTRRIDDADR